MSVSWRPLAGLVVAAIVAGLSVGCRQEPAGEGPDDLAATRTPVHVAFAGGGWRAHTGHAAWTMSLLENGALTLDSAFANVQTLSSNSGGTWFSTMLTYSEAFRESIEGDSAFHRYVHPDSGYLGQQQQLFEGFDMVVDPAMCDPIKDKSQYLYFYCRLAVLAGGKGVVWTDIVDNVVFKPFGMYDELANTSLGDARQPWADDKALLMAATLLTDSVVLNSTGGELAAYIGPWVYYNATTRTDATPVNVTPVTFSSVPSGWRPLTLLRAGGLKAKYTTAALARGGSPPRDSATIDSLRNTDSVPVLAATAASSAAAGAAASNPVLAASLIGSDTMPEWPYAYALSDLAVPFSLTPLRAYDTLSPADTSVQKLAESAYVRLADGGYLDNSAVAQLVSFLQANGQTAGFQIVAFDNVQQVYEPGGEAAPVGIDIAYLFGKGLDGPNQDEICFGTSTDEFCVTVPDQQIFDSASLVTTPVTWHYPIDQSHRLIYTQYAVTTVRNATLGVTGGTSGTLHVFTCLWPDADTGPWNGSSDFEAYQAMLYGIRQGLESGGGLGYLRAALYGRSGP